jgi:quercetin dioxygenase-like cupin family protein
MAVECQFMADEPLVLPFDSLDWEEEAPGIRARAAEVTEQRWALVEYAQGAQREEWCADGHRGLVLEGAIEYEFNDGSPPLSAAKGEAFRLPGGSGHRGRNVAAAPTRLFLIDDPA